MHLPSRRSTAYCLSVAVSVATATNWNAAVHSAIHHRWADEYRPKEIEAYMYVGLFTRD